MNDLLDTTTALQIGDDYWSRSHRLRSWDVTRWQRYLYQTRHDASSTLRDAVGEVRSALLGYAIEAGGGEDLQDTKRACAEDAFDFGGEIFSRLYSDGAEVLPDSLVDSPSWFQKVNEVLEGSEEFKQLRESVVGDPDFSALGAMRILSVVAEMLPEILREEPEDEEQEQESQDEDSEGEDEGSDEGEGDNSPQESDEGQSQGQMALHAAIAGAVREAIRDGSDKKAALAAIAPGSEFAPVSTDQGSARRLLLAERISQDPRLREIVRRAGRIRRLSRTDRHVPSKVARDTISGLERGGDVSRILPVELAKLRHPTLRKLALRSILERKALQYEYTGTEPLGRGPVVVLLDESTSMAGAPHDWARSIGLACVAMALREKRAITVAGFNAGISHVHHVDRRGRGHVQAAKRQTSWDDRTQLTRKERCSSAEVSLSIASIAPGGGTRFGAALTWALDHGLEDDRADLIFVTDGEDYIRDPSIIDRLNKAKSKGLRVYGCTINGGQISEAVQAICDEVVPLDESDDKARSAAVISL